MTENNVPEPVQARQGINYATQDDRLLVALEWLNYRADTNGKGFISAPDVAEAAVLFAHNDLDTLRNRLFKFIVTGEIQ